MSSSQRQHARRQSSRGSTSATDGIHSPSTMIGSRQGPRSHVSIRSRGSHIIEHVSNTTQSSSRAGRSVGGRTTSTATTVATSSSHGVHTYAMEEANANFFLHIGAVHQMAPPVDHDTTRSIDGMNINSHRTVGYNELSLKQSSFQPLCRPWASPRGVQDINFHTRSVTDWDMVKRMSEQHMKDDPWHNIGYVEHVPGQGTVKGSFQEVDQGRSRR